MKVWKIDPEDGLSYGYNPVDFCFYHYKYHRKIFMFIVRILMLPIQIACAVGASYLVLKLSGVY